MIPFLLLLALVACGWYFYQHKYSTDYQHEAPGPEDFTEDAAEDVTAALQAQIDLDHWAAQLQQFKALQATHKAEIAAIREYREKKLIVLPSLADKPFEYMELATWLTENKRDYSEKREAIVQRALITDANNIYACQKRIAKARQILKGE